MTEMNTAWTAASEETYKATQNAGGGAEAGADSNQGGTSNSAGGSENVTDTEFEEVK